MKSIQHIAESRLNSFRDRNACPAQAGKWAAAGSLALEQEITRTRERCHATPEEDLTFMHLYLEDLLALAGQAESEARAACEDLIAMA